MTFKPVPSKLGREPLIDVICEVRFEAFAPAGSLLPGSILARLGEREFQFEAMPIAQLPPDIRKADPNLRHAALMRITVDQQFIVLISDHSLAVGCKMPYVGWTKFKEMILSTFSVLNDAPYIKKIERHSLKYVDLFENESNVQTSLARFEIDIRLAQHRISNESINLRAEISIAPFIHATTVASPATVTLLGDKAPRQGAIIDVDTHRIEEYERASDFIEKLPVLLEEIHDANKTFFFSLLSDAGLNELEPHYD